jgi:hypothetical protein
VDPSLDDSTAIDWSLISTRALISLYEANKERFVFQFIVFNPNCLLVKHIIVIVQYELSVEGTFLLFYSFFANNFKESLQ